MAETMGVQAVFPSDAALQDAIGRLTQLGFDRAELSVPDLPASLASTTGGGTATLSSEQTNSSPMTETDTRQARTLATSMAGTAGAFAAAGLTIATGGAAAVAAGAALAAGAGAAGAARLGSAAAAQPATDQRREAAARGELTLQVQTRTAEKAAVAETALREAGGQHVTRLLAGSGQSIDSSAWTG